MKTTAIAFHLTMNDQEKAWLSLEINAWFTNCINGEENLFGDVSKAMLILDVQKQINAKKVVVEITWLQAKYLVEVIENHEKRMKPKTWEVYIPKDFCHRDMYDELVKLAARKI